MEQTSVLAATLVPTETQCLRRHSFCNKEEEEPSFLATHGLLEVHTPTSPLPSLCVKTE